MPLDLLGMKWLENLGLSCSIDLTDVRSSPFAQLLQWRGEMHMGLEAGVRDLTSLLAMCDGVFVMTEKEKC